MNAVETNKLGKRFGRFWALQDVSIEVPVGCVSGLVGPNGAGKSTLMQILVGLNHQTTGTAAVHEQAPVQHSDFLKDVGYLAQDIPLYRRLSANDHIEMCKNMNKNWDEAFARKRLNDLGIDPNKASAKLSGGQRSQVALALALAKHPKVLLLDEPVAALDPLARRDFLTALTTAVAEDELSVVMSSHLVADLERVCDHLVLITAARVQLCERIDTLLESHKFVSGPRQETLNLDKNLAVIQATHTARQTTLLVRADELQLDQPWEVSDPNLEELVLAYMGQDEQASASPFKVMEGGQ